MSDGIDPDEERIDPMNAIAPYAQILDIDFGKDVLKKIEWIGRTCYKSTDGIKEDSAEKFVSNLIKRGHEAMLEHASFCFELPCAEWNDLRSGIRFLENYEGFNCFLRFTCDQRYLVSGNVRAWRDLMKRLNEICDYLPLFMRKFIRENPVLFPEFQENIKFVGDSLTQMKPIFIDDLKTENEFLTHCDITVQFVVDRGISHELVRHRPASFAQESTRYCNYGKDKFGNQITFIIPHGFKFGSVEWGIWKNIMQTCEADYLTMIKNGVSPEWARSMLPNSVKTEVIMTANCSEWIHFFKLRACNMTGKAHPQMLEVSRPLLDDFKKTISVIFEDLAYE